MQKIILLILITVNSIMFAVDYYVSPNGSDDNIGSLEEPFKTIKKVSLELKAGDTCYLREGVYREVLKPENSGSPESYITYTNYNDEKVTLTGCDILTNWKKENSNLYYADMNWTLEESNQLFFNGEIITEASWPSPGIDPLTNPQTAIIESHNSKNKTFVNSRIPGSDKDWIGAKLWCGGGLEWIRWTGEVKDFDSNTGAIKYKTPGYDGDPYSPIKGNPFVLKGVKAALTSPGEWYYNSKSKQIYIIPLETEENNFIIEAKKRIDVIDLTDKSYIKLDGINFYSGTVITNKNSKYITLENIKGRYISHSYTEWDSESSGVQILGNNITVLNCEFGYSSGAVLMVKGSDNKIINNYFHNGNYAGLWQGAVALSGRRQLFSHNTVKNSGRDLLSIHQLMESLIQYNDLSNAGLLTMDLGIIYGHNSDFANTQIRYNWVHDNKSSHLAMGIYFDIASYNPIIYKNVIWNTTEDPVRFNNPVYNALVFNNSAYNTGETSTFGYFLNRGLYFTRFINNIFNDKINFEKHVKLENNKISKNPGYLNPTEQDFRLKKNSENRGAYNTEDFWKAGHDFNNPPNPLPQYEPANIPWMNIIVNSSFEFGSLEGWKKTGANNAILIEGNNWGNEWGGSNLHQTGTNFYELELKGESDRVEQKISGLKPNTKYRLSGWLRVSDSKTKIKLGVENTGLKDVSKSNKSKNWTRKEIKFETGPKTTSVKVYIEIEKGKGYAWADNLTLPLTQ